MGYQLYNKWTSIGPRHYLDDPGNFSVFWMDAHTRTSRLEQWVPLSPTLFSLRLLEDDVKANQGYGYEGL